MPDMISLHVEDRTRCFQCALSKMIESEFPAWDVQKLVLALIETLAFIGMDADSPDNFVTAVTDDLRLLIPQCSTALLDGTICEASKHQEGDDHE
jgi:hypothetical protein